MSECKKCGRDDGHWIGCAETLGAEKKYDWNGGQEPAPLDAAMKALLCAFGECANPKRPKGKGPAPKYCEEHSDPKNRKA